MMNYNESSTAASTFLAFAFFAGHAFCTGYFYDLLASNKLVEDETEASEEETKAILLYIVAAILCGTTVLYGLFKCVGSQCMLILRAVGNFCAMVIFLGFKCEVLNKDVSLQDDAKDTLSSQSESTVAFALAWVIISTFELNENSFCQYHCTRWVAKAQLFLFWVLFAVSTCVEGEELLENAKEAEDTEAKTSAYLLIGTTVAAALAALCFVLFSLCEATEFIRLHVLAGSLTGILYISSIGHQYYHFYKEVNDLIDETENELLIEFYEFMLKLGNWHFAGALCLGFSILCTIGFDQFFFATPTMKSSQSQRPGVTIQIAH